MIKFTCPHCRKTLQVKDQLGGKRGACPKCKKIISIPALAASKSEKKGSGSSVDMEALAAAALSDGEKKEGPQSTLTVDFTCPYCDAELHLSPDVAGKQAPCTECRRIVKVPLLQKAGPRDWRQPDKQAGPSGAKRTDEAPEGAWGSVSGVAQVSRAALVEADVIKIETEPLTIGQWTIRIALVLFVIVAASVGYMWFTRSKKANLEQDAMTIAEDFLKSPGARQLSPELQTALLTRLGEYYSSRQKVDAQGNSGLPRFQQALQVAPKIDDPVEQQAALRDIALTQLAVGLEGDDVGGILGLIPAGHFRYELIRDICRHYLTGVTSPEEVDKRASAVKQMIQKNVGSQATAAPAGRPGATAPAGQNFTEQIACLAILGQELARAGHATLAGRFADTLVPQFKAEQGYPRPLQALLIMLKKPELEGTKDQQSDMQAGRAEGLALAGDFGNANQVIDSQLKVPLLSKAEAVFVVAAELAAKGQKQEAQQRLAEVVTIIEPFPLESAWLRQQMVQLTAAVSSADEAEKLAANLLTGAALARSKLALLELRLKQNDGKAVDPNVAAGVDAKSAAYTTAVFRIARHNAASDPVAAFAWSKELQPEPLRPFAALGVATGMKP